MSDRATAVIAAVIAALLGIFFTRYMVSGHTELLVEVLIAHHRKRPARGNPGYTARSLKIKEAASVSGLFRCCAILSRSVAAPILVAQQLKTNIRIRIGAEISSIPTVYLGRPLGPRSISGFGCVVVQPFAFVCSGECRRGHQGCRTENDRKKFECVRVHGAPRVKQYVALCRS